MRLLASALLFVAVLAACGGDSKPALFDQPSSATPPPATATQPATPTPDGVVTIAAVGDVMLARDLVTLMEEEGAQYPFERVAALLQDADLTIANMEGAFTERGEPLDKLYTFRTPPRFAKALTLAGIDVVSLGNNHTGDFGPESVEDTLAALDAAGVAHTGAGIDDAAARRPYVVEVDGVRLGFLSYSGIDESAFADLGQPGVARATVDNVSADVAAARARADVVIVLVHAGVEYTDAPQPDQQAFARAAVDAGAALVIGHHPHTLQGTEAYNGGVIVYSLGNFVFDLDAEDLSNLGPRAFETAVLYVTLDVSGVRDMRMQPVVIDEAENRPRPANEAEASRIRQRIVELDALAGGP